MSLETEVPASKLRLGLMWSRMKKACRLDQQGVLELKTDTTSTGQAVAVLVLAALAYGIGYTAQTQFQRHDLSIYGIIVGSLANTVTVCFAAFVWSATAFLVGTKLFQGKTGYWELARPLFFASSPFLLFLLITIPVPPILAQGNVPVYWFQGNHRSRCCSLALPLTSLCSETSHGTKSAKNSPHSCGRPPHSGLHRPTIRNRLNRFHVYVDNPGQHTFVPELVHDLPFWSP